MGEGGGREGGGGDAALPKLTCEGAGVQLRGGGGSREGRGGS